MSRTDLDAATLANSLRMKAGDGSVEWVAEPIQASVLLDIADMLDENARLKQELESVGMAAYLYGRNDFADENAKLQRLATLEQHIDEHGNVSVRISDEFVVLTHDEAELIRRKFDQLKAKNTKLLELLQDYHRYEHEDCYSCRYINECRADESGRCIAPIRLGERYRELEVEVDT